MIGIDVGNHHARYVSAGLMGIKCIAKTERNATVRPGQHRSEDGPLRVRITSGRIAPNRHLNTKSKRLVGVFTVGNASITIVARTEGQLSAMIRDDGLRPVAGIAVIRLSGR